MWGIEADAHEWVEISQVQAIETWLINRWYLEPKCRLLKDNCRKTKPILLHGQDCILKLAFLFHVSFWAEILLCWLLTLADSKQGYYKDLPQPVSKEIEDYQIHRSSLELNILRLKTEQFERKDRRHNSSRSSIP